MEALTPAQTIEKISRIGAEKAKMRIDKMVATSILGGMLLGFGCALNVSTSTAPWFQTNAPGLIKTIGACFFPVGLIMVFLSGADLFTSYCMYSVVSFLHRRIGVLDIAKTFGISFVSNLGGILFVCLVLMGYGGTFDSSTARAEAISIATAKVITPLWHQIFLRAIVANWLVCMAVFLQLMSREVVSKILAIWFPTMAFTALGADHVIANMFYIPLGIFEGAPISVGLYIYKSMIPAALGNVVGGSLFVGTMFWYLHLSGGAEPELPLHQGGGEVTTITGDGGRTRASTLVNDESRNPSPVRNLMKKVTGA